MSTPAPILEFRSVALDHLDERVSDEGTFAGYACRADIVDSYGTTFRSGAWGAGGLDDKPYPLLWMHDGGEPIGVFTAREDEHGLHISGHYDQTPEGLRARARAKSGSAGELSVGFHRVANNPENDAEIVVANLVEVSQITRRFASQPGASVEEVRSVAMAVRAKREAELHRRRMAALLRLRG